MLTKILNLINSKKTVSKTSASQIEIKDGDVYVVRFGEDTFVKRLFRVPGKLIAKSDNAIYPEFDLTSDSFEVLGKVIYKMEEA